MNGAHVAPFPMTVHTLSRTCAGFKVGRYVSFNNYASRARQEHHSLGHDWNPRLEKEMVDGTRSVLRGVGPSRQSQPLPLELIVASEIELVMEDDMPVGVKEMIVFGSLFMMREVELSLLRCRHVAIDMDARTVTVRLPASKNDIEGTVWTDV